MVKNCTVNKLVGLSCFGDLSLQVHLSACLSVSRSIVVLLSMPDLQLYPDSPNDNAAGKKEAS